MPSPAFSIALLAPLTVSLPEKVTMPSRRDATAASLSLIERISIMLSRFAARVPPKADITQPTALQVIKYRRRLPRLRPFATLAASCTPCENSFPQFADNPVFPSRLTDFTPAFGGCRLTNLVSIPASSGRSPPKATASPLPFSSRQSRWC